jgi:hypothetical protein
MRNRYLKNCSPILWSSEAREAGEGIKPGVKRSGTPGSNITIKGQPVKRAKDN